MAALAKAYFARNVHLTEANKLTTEVQAIASKTFDPKIPSSLELEFTLGDLQEQRFRRHIRMVVRQEIERHRGNLVQQFVQRRRVGGSRDVVTMPAPDRRLLIPGRGNRENDRPGHRDSVACPDASEGS